MSGYDDIKNELTKRGFQYISGNEAFTLTYDQVVGVSEINGQRHEQKERITIRIDYIGEGSISNTDDSNLEPLYGFGVNTPHGSVDIWVRDWPDFENVCPIRFEQTT